MLLCDFLVLLNVKMDPSRYSYGFLARFLKLLCLLKIVVVEIVCGSYDFGLNSETAKGKRNDRTHYVLL